MLLLNGINVFHPNENLVCVIKERAANAIRTYVDTFSENIEYGSSIDLNYKGLIDKANELEREAISVQRNIRGLL